MENPAQSEIQICTKYYQNQSPESGGGMYKNVERYDFAQNPENRQWHDFGSFGKGFEFTSFIGKKEDSPDAEEVPGTSYYENWEAFFEQSHSVVNFDEVTMLQGSENVWLKAYDSDQEAMLSDNPTA